MKSRALLDAYSIDPLDPDPVHEILFWPQIRILRVQFSVVWSQILASVYLDGEIRSKSVECAVNLNLLQNEILYFKQGRPVVL